MLTIVIALSAALIAWCGIFFAIPGEHWAWATLTAILALILTSIPLNLWIRKRMEALFNKVQLHIVQSQEQLKTKANALQFKIQNQAKLMEIIEKDQATSIRQAITMLDDIAPLQKWNVLAVKQANTLKGSLLYQIKDFTAAEPLLLKAMILDPMTLAMQMALHYRKDNLEAVEKLFHKGTGRFKNEKATLIFALYSWILVQKGRIKEAIVVLDSGKDRCENEILRKNWEALTNDRTRQFSNAGFGEQWYALLLETPTQPRPRQQMPFGGRPTRGGFR